MKILERDGSGRISFREMLREMVVMAKPLLYDFNMYFGSSDKMRERLNLIPRGAQVSGDSATGDAGESLTWSSKDEIEKTLRFVPYRWLTPFFDVDLKKRKIKEGSKNGEIERLAAAQFEGRSPPPYKFEREVDEKFIRVHPEWNRHLFNNMDVIRGWIMWHWADFLQDRNPNMPAIIKKIDSADANLKMDKQREFWRKIIEAQGGQTTCVYSGEAITYAECDIGHFLPWNFAGHCHLWNLSPIKKEVNLSKGVHIPDESYLSNLVNAQCKAMNTRMNHFPDKWENLIDSYHADLGIPSDKLTDRDALSAAYDNIVLPAIKIAANRKFPTGWKWVS